MAEFTIKRNKAYRGPGFVFAYAGPFGPAEIHQGPGPDLTFTVEGGELPAASLELGPPMEFSHRLYATRLGEPFVARVGELDVDIRNERAHCLPALGRNPILSAQAPDRRYVLRLNALRARKVVRADGSVVATLRKKGSIEDASDPVDVTIALLLRFVGVIWDRISTDVITASGPYARAGSKPAKR